MIIEAESDHLQAGELTVSKQEKPMLQLSNPRPKVQEFTRGLLVRVPDSKGL
jgi:hypothetical protein